MSVIKDFGCGEHFQAIIIYKLNLYIIMRIFRPEKLNDTLDIVTLMTHDQCITILFNFL